MAIRRIIELGDPMLRQAAAPIADPAGAQVRTLLADLRETLEDFRARTGYGRSLAAPQVGVLLRALLIVAEEGVFEMLNPRYERWSRSELQSYESCLCFPSIWGLVTRPASVKLLYQSPDGAEQQLEATGGLARLAQHAMDHLDGLVWLDRSPDLQSLCTTGEYERRYKPTS
jgi:peptide deformylase